MTNAIVQSCDVYFYALAQKIGFHKILKTMNDLNLNDTFDIYQSKIISTDQYDLLNWSISDTIYQALDRENNIYTTKYGFYDFKNYKSK